MLNWGPLASALSLACSTLADTTCRPEVRSWLFSIEQTLCAGAFLSARYSLLFAEFIEPVFAHCGGGTGPEIFLRYPFKVTCGLLYIIAIYAPMIYTAPCVCFQCGQHPLRGQVGGGWALEIETFLGPVKWHWADRRVPFGAQKSRCHFTGPKKVLISRAQPRADQSLRSWLYSIPDFWSWLKCEWLGPDPTVSYS